jgi:RNA-directed DNA polymerase
MSLLRQCYAKLKLRINEAKSAVASAFERKFLGYALWWCTKSQEVKCKVADKALANFKTRIRQLTSRTGGRSMSQVVEKLRSYLLGWKAYFGLAQTPGTRSDLDRWIRRRLRAIQRKQWKRPKTIYRELRAMGASDGVAKQVAATSGRWWYGSANMLNRVLNIKHFDQLGLPRLS